MIPEPRFVYRVLLTAEWLQFRAEEAFAGNAADRRDGYIHLSLPEQLAATLKTHFDGVTDIVIAEIDVGKIQSALRWERSRGGELFPHLYGNLPLAAVVRTLDAGALPLPGGARPGAG